MGRFVFAGRVLWNALGKRLTAVLAAVTAAPAIIDWLSRQHPAFQQLSIPNPWMWSAIGALATLCMTLFIRLYALEDSVSPKIEIASSHDEITEPATGADKVIRYLRLEVRN